MEVRNVQLKRKQLDFIDVPRENIWIDCHDELISGFGKETAEVSRCANTSGDFISFSLIASKIIIFPEECIVYKYVVHLSL
jgi:hypothetical protein